MSGNGKALTMETIFVTYCEVPGCDFTEAYPDEQAAVGAGAYHCRRLHPAGRNLYAVERADVLERRVLAARRLME